MGRLSWLSFNLESFRQQSHGSSLHEPSLIIRIFLQCSSSLLVKYFVMKWVRYFMFIWGNEVAETGRSPTPCKIYFILFYFYFVVFITKVSSLSFHSFSNFDQLGLKTILLKGNVGYDTRLIEFLVNYLCYLTLFC
jgi:hypothetical protein